MKPLLRRFTFWGTLGLIFFIYCLRAPSAPAQAAPQPSVAVAASSSPPLASGSAAIPPSSQIPSGTSVLLNNARKSNGIIENALDKGDLATAQDEKPRLDATVSEINALASAPGAPADAKTANTEAKQLADDAGKVDDASNSAGCSGQTDWCFVGGAALAGYSITGGAGERKGQTSHHIVQLIIPELGVRYAASRYVSVDLVGYTALISPELQVNQISRAGTGCATKGGTFEDSLPCEGSAALRPIGAGLLGVTVGTGSSSLGIITVGLTAGGARTSQDATPFGFWGLMVTTAGIYKTVPIGKTKQESASAGKAQK